MIYEVLHEGIPRPCYSPKKEKGMIPYVVVPNGCLNDSIGVLATSHEEAAQIAKECLGKEGRYHAMSETM